jgi:hypothetical protein
MAGTQYVFLLRGHAMWRMVPLPETRVLQTVQSSP